MIHWAGTSQWLWAGVPVEIGQNRDQMMAGRGPHDARRHARLRSADGPGRARDSLGLPDAAVKHLIIISDGDPSPPSAGDDQRPEKHGRDGIDGGRRRPRPAGSRT